MATLVLTVVGGAIGGPIGAALGAVVGGAVDREIIFRGKGREGPRLTELAVQTSSYGTPIAKVFGTMRVAGSVVWSTELIEHATRVRAGKGGPRTTNYSYSASFAVLLSARPILGVRRIWADGKLLRGAGGDFKTQTGFRLHLGDESQAPDPLIASAEGIAVTPALRGCAYAVFEELALADFGNRIPSLTFEVEADAGPVAAGAIVTEVSGGVVDGAGLTLPLGGYAAYGSSLRALTDSLAEAGGAWFAHDGARLALRAGDGAASAIDDAGAGSGARGVRSVASADGVPRRLSIQYHDPARDYQAGLQHATRPGAGTRAERIELPAAVTAETAKALATAALARADVERERRSVTLDWRAIGIAPGDRVTIAGESGSWRVTGWSLEAMVLTLELLRVSRAPVAVPATPGRVLPVPDDPAGATIVHLFEIPPVDDTLPVAPRLFAAAGGTGAGWRGAALQLSLDGGVSWSPAGDARAAATLGTLAVAPGAASATIADRRHAIEVVLAHDAMTLEDAEDAALDRGANLALVGDELVQFARADRIAPARWRLTGLWRGRRGTEWAMGGARAGDRFVLIEAAALVAIDLPATAAGSIARVMAAGIGDGDDPPVATAAVTGDSCIPPAPVAPDVAPLAGGEVALTWRRRSRAGWRWIDGVDAPLVEERERYRVTVSHDGGSAGTFETEAPAMTLPAAYRAGPHPRVAVAQIGSHGLSRAAAVALPTA